MAELRRSAGEVVLMDRIECEYCKQQNPTDRVNCLNCDAPLDIRDRISVSDPGSNQHHLRVKEGKSPEQMFASASCQRVWGVLTAFHPGVFTPRMMNQTYYGPELMDALHCSFQVEARFPDRAPANVVAQQPVPHEIWPAVRHAVGSRSQVVCGFDPNNLGQMGCVVDLSSIPTVPPKTSWWRRGS